MERAIRPYWPVFVLPTLLACIIGFVIPFAMGFYLSFCDFTTLSDAVFTGFSNYIRAFSDGSGEFMHSLWYTELFAVLSTLLITVLALLVALALIRGFRGTNGFRTVFFMPNLIGGIVLGWLWQVILNGFLSRRGVTLVTNEWYGFWGLMIVVVWQQMGYMMVLYIAGLQAIPPEILEAAAIDGASPFQTFRHVKLPMLMPTVTVCTFLTLTNGLKLFDQNLALTGGMPSNRSQLLALNIYSTFYGRAGWAGAGQAKAVVFCLIVAGIAILQLRLTRTQEVQR